MEDKMRKQLGEKGFRVGSAADLLELTPEVACIDYRQVTRFSRQSGFNRNKYFNGRYFTLQ